MSQTLPRVLVTGAEGFVARHLLPPLLAESADVVATVLQPTEGSLHSQRLHQTTLDITNAEHTQTVIRDVRPSHIIHLAGLSSVRDSFTNPSSMEDVNLQGTRNLLEAAASLPRLPRVLIIGSGEEYGSNAGTPLPELPLGELHPVSPYGKSKKAVEVFIEGSPALRSMTIRTRSFPHIGPGQSLKFFIPEVVAQIWTIAQGNSAPVIHVGNLEAVRDFTDVRDVARAYLLLLHQGVAGEVYNVCSGVPQPVRSLLDILLRLSSIHAQIVQDPQKMRPVDIPVLVGDYGKLRHCTGWMPKIPLEKTLSDILEAARPVLP